MNSVEGVDAMTQEEYRKAAIDAVKKLSADVGRMIAFATPCGVSYNAPSG